MMLWHEKLELDTCTESSVATRTDHDPPPPPPNPKPNPKAGVKRKLMTHKSR